MRHGWRRQTSGSRQNAIASAAERKVLGSVPSPSEIANRSRIFRLVALLSTMTAHNWFLMVVWTAIGFLVYFMYGHRHSKLRRGN